MKLLGLGKAHLFPLARLVTEEDKGGKAYSTSLSFVRLSCCLFSLPLFLRGLFETTREAGIGHERSGILKEQFYSFSHGARKLCYSRHNGIRAAQSCKAAWLGVITPTLLANMLWNQRVDNFTQELFGWNSPEK